MRKLRTLNQTNVPALVVVLAILMGLWPLQSAWAGTERAVENGHAILQRDITLWSDGARLPGVLLYPKDRKEGQNWSITSTSRIARGIFCEIPKKTGVPVENELVRRGIPATDSIKLRSSFTR